MYTYTGANVRTLNGAAAAAFPRDLCGNVVAAEGEGKGWLAGAIRRGCCHIEISAGHVEPARVRTIIIANK